MTKWASLTPIDDAVRDHTRHTLDPIRDGGFGRVAAVDTHAANDELRFLRCGDSDFL